MHVILGRRDSALLDIALARSDSVTCRDKRTDCATDRENDRQMNVSDACLCLSRNTPVANGTPRKLDMYLKVSGIIEKRLKEVMRK